MADSETQELTFEEMLDRIGELVEELERAEPPVRETALELLDYLSTWHGEAIMRLATSLPPDVLEGARSDPVIAHLFDMYLAEDDHGDPSELIEEALEEIRPYVHSHGGEMDLVSVEDGVVTLKLMGSCDGCPSSMVTLTQGVEKILRDKWPTFRQLKVEGEEDPHHHHKDKGPQLLQIQSLKRK